jgi:prepilin-type N-terminal cleavage/methylation domain-containing protein
MTGAKQRGFTLIEMSIVLVVIGLIVGGVLVGRDLIRAAGVRATVTQIEKYSTAAGMVSDSSFAGEIGTTNFPGDFTAYEPH